MAKNTFRLKRVHLADIEMVSKRFMENSIVKMPLVGLPRGIMLKHRVFFKDEATAIAAGYHPCGKCMKPHYNLYKEGKIIPGDLEATKQNVDFL